ncbi:MAG: DUF6128 domain-containing protein [Eubacteriales bacterium]|nr:DUF6128 domain-containing protein [Eubacteriales bacterium]
MTDYSRFIAYIYEYVNGIKQYNAGFTKVEVRNGICKLQLMIKNTGRETKVKVYGLVREDGWLLGILLGEGQTQRQRLDLRIMTDSEKIGGTDYPFRKITGLFIQGAEGRTYATAWDEEPIFLDKFVTELPEKKSEVQALEMEETEEEREDVVSEETKNELRPSDDLQEQSEERNRDRRKEKSQQEIQNEAENGMPSEPDCVPDEEKRPKSKEERWNTIVASFPRTDPFSDEEIEECVQISPKDLMLVCQEEWRLGRNSFLLHGYYNYRHLILGRTKDGRWVLGIPGVYERQEHFVAARFGFAGFKPAKSNKTEEKPFGYWCRVLI